MSSSFSKSCKYCGVAISLKESSPGRWEAFGRGGKPHVCKKGSAPKSAAKPRSKPEALATKAPKRNPPAPAARRRARQPAGKTNAPGLSERFWRLSIGRRVLLTLVVSMLLWTIWSQFFAGSDRTGDLDRKEPRVNAARVRPE